MYNVASLCNLLMVNPVQAVPERGIWPQASPYKRFG